MIVSDISAGLGNQLFQYAFGRRTALKLGASLKLDTRKALHYGLRPYWLDRFNIEEQFATEADLDYLRKRRSWLERFRILPWDQRVFVFEPEGWFHPFNPKLLELSDNIRIEGYWQSEKYFADIAETLRKEFTLKDAPDSRNREWVERFLSEESVSIHVRRGDYLTRPTALEKFARLSPDYYRSAIEYIRGKVDNPRFYIFSDEPDWARTHFQGDAAMTVMDGNSPNDYLDFWLMSQCRHHIIANSSFSWWAAWLSKHGSKIVIAPKRWFNLSDEENDADAMDRIPGTWIRL
jgi:hypothetical protein